MGLNRNFEWCIECGAREGANDLMCRKWLDENKNRRAVFLEPHDGRFATLHNRFDKSEHLCLQLGLSDYIGYNSDLNWHTSTKVKFTGNVVTWDFLVDILDIDFAWAIIDTELHEEHVLRGMNNRLPKKLTIEMHLDIHDQIVAKGYTLLKKQGENNIYGLSENVERR